MELLQVLTSILLIIYVKLYAVEVAHNQAFMHLIRCCNDMTDCDIQNVYSDLNNKRSHFYNPFIWTYSQMFRGL